MSIMDQPEVQELIEEREALLIEIARISNGKADIVVEIDSVPIAESTLDVVRPAIVGALNSKVAECEIKLRTIFRDHPFDDGSEYRGADHD